jgi:hypothetical protein
MDRRCLHLSPNRKSPIARGLDGWDQGLYQSAVPFAFGSDSLLHIVQWQSPLFPPPPFPTPPSPSNALRPISLSDFFKLRTLQPLIRHSSISRCAPDTPTNPSHFWLVIQGVMQGNLRLILNCHFGN